MNSTTGAAGADFASYSKAAVRRFLRTAVLIDDDIYVAEIAEPAEPVVAPAFAEGSPLAKAEVAPTAAPPEVSDTGAAKTQSEVSLKPLADAFLDRHIVCGVLKPEKTDDVETVIERAVESARAADIFIIDWYLRQGSADMAKEILARVLENDRKLNGRLRLVIVYTSATPIAEKCAELREYLAGRSFAAAGADAGATTVVLDSCRIRFVEKAFGASGVAVEALPDLAIAEFSDQAKGLLASFTLTGISALREATHHLLATFSARLDPAFVGHRMLIQQPEDSQEFALNILMLQIRGVLSLPYLLGSSLLDAEIGAWFDDRYASEEAGAALTQLRVTKDALRKVVIGGGSKQKALHTALFVPPTSDKPEETELEVSSDFARLTTFVREFKGYNPLPANWLPSLTLGSVLRLTENGRARHLLCVQPLCDTVRLKEARFFAFAELKPKDTKKSDFWLVVREGDKRLHLRIDDAAGSRHYDSFTPFEETGLVRASGTENFIFTSQGGKTYEWIGDVDRPKAQKAATDLSTALARVGLDEYEWLRLGATSKSK